MKIPRLIATREHGSWAVLLVPLFSGALSAHQWSFRITWLVLAELNIFLAYVPVQILLRHSLHRTQDSEKLRSAKFWTTVNLVLAGVCAAPLFFQKLWLLFPAGMLGAISFLVNFLLNRKFQKSIAGDFSAVAGLTLGAPCAYYVITGTLGAAAVAVYAFNLLFFGSSVFYVHMKIQATRSATAPKVLTSVKNSAPLAWTEKCAIGKWNIIYHAALLVIVIALVVSLHEPLFVFAAFVPMIIHAVYGTLTMESKIRFRNLGFILLAHAVWFGIIVGFSSW